MDKRLFAKKSSKIDGGHNILVATEFLSVDYFEPPASVDEVRSSDTGHLELLRIEPKRTGLPSFSIRLDHSVRLDEDDLVDVDLLSSSEEEVRLFKAGKNGYRGHHTHRLDRDSRTHVIDIEAPGTGPVFKGTVTLNLDLAEFLNF